MRQIERKTIVPRTQWCAKACVYVCFVFGGRRRLIPCRANANFACLPILSTSPYLCASFFLPSAFLPACINMDMLPHSFLFYNRRITHYMVRLAPPFPFLP